MSAPATGAQISSPYKGLAAFDDSDVDALLFFGRQWETEVVAANVLASRLTVLYGPSGVGKSSLLRAGVVRTLRHAGDPSPAVAYFGTWAGEPLAGLEEAARAAVGDALGREPGDAPGDLTDRFAAWSAELGAELCLLIDQLEELFLYHPAKEGAAGFVDLLPELVLRPGLRVNVLLGVRDDALAQLDVFKERIPGLFMNSLRLDHLDRAAGREAILGPLGRYAAIAGAGAAMTIEPDLVEDLLDQVSTGRIEPSLAGRGAVEGAQQVGRVETPYLQLVLQRLWEIERERGSSVLRRETFLALGGAEQIVEDHLERALRTLTPSEQDAAANVFDHLVTPSGTKIAHGVGDLASYASVGERELEPVLASLASQRILRPLGENGHAGDRYEIFHDVLAGAVLAWRTRHEADAALEEERKRRRRLGWLAAAALVGLAMMAALAAYAFSQRTNARQQAAAAEEQQALAEERRNDVERTNAELAKTNEARKKAVRQWRKAAARAAVLADNANRQKNSAVRSQNKAEAAQADADKAADLANKAARAEAQLRREAVALAAEAKRAANRAKTQKRNAEKATIAAEDAKQRANARRYIARSVGLVGRDPESSAAAAIQASELAENEDDQSDAENALRAALVAMSVQHVLAGGGSGAGLAQFGANGRPAAEVARFSANGRRAVVGVGNNSPLLRVFRTGNGKVMRTFTAGTPVRDVALDKDGRFVAAAGDDGRVWVWDVDTRRVRQFVHGPPVTAIAWSPTADVLASVGGTVARLWDTSTGGSRLLSPQGDNLKAAVFSPDGGRIATYGEGRFVRIFDVDTAIRIATLPYPASALQITSAAFRPDGKAIVTGRGNVARLWDIATSEPEVSFSGQTGTVTDVAFSSNGERVATASLDTVARVFVAETGVLDDTFYGHTGLGINDIDFSPDGSAIVTAGADHTARFSAKGQLSVPLLGHDRAVLDASFSPDGRSVLTSSKDGTARLWDPYGEPVPRTPARYDSSVTSVAVDPSGTLYAVGRDDGGVDVLTPKGHLITSVIAGGGPAAKAVVSVAWASKQTLLTATRDGRVRLWGDAGASPRRELAHEGAIRAAAISTDGTLVATAGDDKNAHLWDLRRDTSLTIPQPDKVNAVAFSPSGKILATASGSSAYTWRTADGKGLRPFTPEGEAGKVTGIAFGPEGGLLATSSEDSFARVWNVRTGQLRTTLVRHGGRIFDVAFSRDGRWLVTGGLRKAGVWQIGDSDLEGHFLFFVAAPRLRQGPVMSVDFTRDHRIVMGTAPRTTAPVFPYGTVRSYKCDLCGRLPQLVTIANGKLARLEEEAHR
jgi:WD40 repeat protein